MMTRGSRLLNCGGTHLSAKVCLQVRRQVKAAEPNSVCSEHTQADTLCKQMLRCLHLSHCMHALGTDCCCMVSLLSQGIQQP